MKPISRLIQLPLILSKGYGYAFNTRILHNRKQVGFQVSRMVSTTTSCSAEMNISSYLKSITTNLVGKTSKMNIIMGNEAGDADSIVSSLSLSYVSKIISSEKTTTFSLPLVSIQRNDLSLRRDVILILEMAGIDTDKLVYMDDDAFTSVAQNGDIQTEITLVDHNKLRSDLWSLEDNIVEILDHHQDEGAHESITSNMRNIAFEGKVALVGSTCTLITERVMATVLKSEKIDAGLGIMLLSVILLDTMNMSEEAAKGTARDGRAIDFLLENTDWGGLQVKNDEMKSNIYGGDVLENQAPSTSHLFEYLRDSKFDNDFWESMSPRDVLRIDYKRFEPLSGASDAFGLSSVLLSMDKVIAKTGFYKDAESYLEEANINLLGVLTMVIVDDKPQRELLLFGEKEEVCKMTKFLVDDEGAAYLEMSRASDDFNLFSSDNKDLAVVRLKQNNPKGSRKQVAPVMMAQYQN